MITEYAPPLRCVKVGAVMAGAWGAALAFLLGSGKFNSFDPERPLQMLMLLVSLTIVAVGIPAYRNADMRNPASLFFLAVGAVLLGAVIALVAFVLFMILLSNWNIGSHR